MKQPAVRNKKNRRQAARKKGFSLVEVILSVGVLGLAILTLVGLVSASFFQIENVVQTNRAISVCSSVEAALYTPELIAGGGRNLKVENNKPRFNAVYDFVREAVNGKRVSLYYLDVDITNIQTGAPSRKTLIYNSPSGNLTQSKYKELGGIGPVFRVDISVAKQLEQQRITLDNNGILLEDAYTGGVLPEVEKYAKGYVPLNFEIFPHNFANNANRNTTPAPVFTQVVIFQR